MISLSRLADIMCHSHAERFTRACNMGQMWGALRLPHQAFHIPLTDHGCKLTQVQNNSTSFLWLPLQGFPGKRQAGRLQLESDRNVLLLFSLSSLLNWPVNKRNWSDPVGGCFQMYESVVKDRRGGGI